MICVRASSEIRANQEPRQGKSPRYRVSEARRCVFDERAQISRSNPTGDPYAMIPMTMWLFGYAYIKTQARREAMDWCEYMQFFKAGQGEENITIFKCAKG